MLRFSPDFFSKFYNLLQIETDKGVLVLNQYSTSTYMYMFFNPYSWLVLALSHSNADWLKHVKICCGCRSVLSQSIMLCLLPNWVTSVGFFQWWPARIWERVVTSGWVPVRTMSVHDSSLCKYIVMQQWLGGTPFDMCIGLIF